MPDPSPVYSQFLPDVYRYAFLVTGSAATATEVLRSTVESASRGLAADARKPGRSKCWLFATAREYCAHPQVLRSPDAEAPSQTADPAEGTAGDLSEEAAPLPTVPGMDDAANAPYRLAAFFAVLPERERSALILFYLFLFDPPELAEVLGIKPAELGPLLHGARSMLQQHRGQSANLFADAAALFDDTPAV